jgi:transposase
LNAFDDEQAKLTCLYESGVENEDLDPQLLAHLNQVRLDALNDIQDQQIRIIELEKVLQEEADRETIRSPQELLNLEVLRKKLHLKKQCLKKDHRNLLSSFFARSFNVVAFSRFESEDMVKKLQNDGARRLIPKSTARLMNEFAFGQFRRTLWRQCVKNNTVCLTTNESYTSKTHYHCLTSQPKGSSQILICKTDCCNRERNQRDENSSLCQWIKVIQTLNGTKLSCD